VRALLLAACLLASVPAAGEELTLNLRPTMALHLGYDSNARRVPHSLQDDADLRTPEDAPPAVVGDGLLIARAGVTAAASGHRLRLRASGTVGGKLFFDTNKPPGDTPEWRRVRTQTRTDVARMLVAQGNVGVAQSLPAGFVSDLDVYAKMRAQADRARTYAFTQSRWALRKTLPLGFTVRGGLRGLFFHSVDTALFTSFGGGAHGGARWYVTTRESFDLDVDLALRAYPFLDPDASDADTEQRRVDAPVRTTFSFTSVRRIFLSAGYIFMRNTSNTLGESYTRHRVFGMTGFRLPAEITASLRGSLQVTQYDTGIGLSQRLYLQDTDESQNSLSLGLSRPWAFGTTVEARLAWYGNELTKGVSQFSRTTAELGIRMEL
jgi:hypothetical protein